MNADTAVIIGAVSLGVIFHIVGVVLGVRKASLKKELLQRLGREYAKLAVAHGKQQPTLQREAALEAFRIIDESADGKRDFTDQQARLFIDELWGK